MKRIHLIFEVFLLLLLLPESAVCASILRPSCGKIYGGPDADWATSIQQTSDGGYIVGGFSGNDGKVLKLSREGNVEWEKLYGSLVRAVLETPDGFYVLGGMNDKQNHDGMLIEIGSLGNEVWKKAFANEDEIKSITLTGGNGFIVSGGKSVIRLDASGAILWSREIEGALLSETKDGNFVACSKSRVTKFTATGDTIWDKPIDATNMAHIHSVNRTLDGGFAIAGVSIYRESNSTDTISVYQKDVGVDIKLPDYNIMKLDADGNKVWEKLYGGNMKDDAYALDATADGGCIVAGTTKTLFMQGADWLGEKVTITDPALAAFMKVPVFNTFFSYIKIAEIEEYFWGLDYPADIGVIKLDSNGNKMWGKRYGVLTAVDARDIQQTSDGGYIIAGSTLSPENGSMDFWIFKINSDGSCDNRF